MTPTIPDRAPKTKPVLTAERVRELFNYDPETGSLVRLISRGSRKAGAVVNYPGQKRGQVRIDGEKFLVHRVVWLTVTGFWPDQDIDHVNGNPSDNRFVNLRLATSEINNQNRRQAQGNNWAGLLGVGSSGCAKRYRASIVVKGRYIHLGCFDTPEEAHAAYLAAKRQLHPGCTI